VSRPIPVPQPEPTPISHSTASATPDGARAASYWRWLAASTAVWLLFGAAMVLSAHSDASRHDDKRSLAAMAAHLLPYFAPLVLYSAICGWAFARRVPTGGVVSVLRLWALALLLFIPLNALFSTLYSAWREAWPALPVAAAWWQQVQRLSLYHLWIDAMIASGTFAALLAWSVWRQRQAHEQRWHAAQADNLRLRLQLLQGQLEPHFLFNALNSVSSLVRSGERTVALSALEQISTLLRLALRASRAERLSVADELEFARTYVDVQRLRFGAALTVDWDFDGHGLDEIACPPLLLQPLIENAVLHGLESNQGRGHIEVRVRLHTPGADAPGMTAASAPRQRTLVVRIGNSLGPDKPGAGHGVGLHSTRERLQLLYGRRAWMHIEASDAHHLVELKLPAEPLA
jgi:two-component system, LytTR family, sensor histidine kinase AlgZ